MFLVRVQKIFTYTQTTVYIRVSSSNSFAVGNRASEYDSELFNLGKLLWLLLTVHLDKRKCLEYCISFAAAAGARARTRRRSSLRVPTDRPVQQLPYRELVLPNAYLATTIYNLQSYLRAHSHSHNRMWRWPTVVCILSIFNTPFSSLDRGY